VELVEMIEGQVVVPIHKTVTRDLEAAARCFKMKCSILDHADQHNLLGISNEYRCHGYPRDPNDEELMDALDHIAICHEPEELAMTDEESIHEANKSEWLLTIERIFSESNRSMFKQRFGLDIWHSFARLPQDQSSNYDPEFGAPQATITYLTLPNSITRSHAWPDNEEIDDDYYCCGTRIVESNHTENGFGMAVSIRKRPSDETLGKFSRALKSLKLSVFVHNSQSPYSTLRFEPSEKSEKSVTPGDSKGAKQLHKPKSAGGLDRTATTLKGFPRPMLLTRHNE
jgi:hypothetical protein